MLLLLLQLIVDSILAATNIIFDAAAAYSKGIFCELWDESSFCV
jgi:hypothetical protein